jgi:hypothetical protein
MCNVAPDVMTKLEQTVRQFLDEGRMFTGYDVTLETRERENIKLQHRDCRGAVHEMTFLNDAVEFGFDNSNGQTVKWGKTQVDMGNGGAWAFVYHPENLDPKTYQPRTTSPAQNTTSVTLAPTTPVSTAVATVTDDSDSSKDSGGENSDGTFSTDYRNRLFIKTRFVRGIGLKASDTITIVTDSAKQTVTLYADASAAPQPGHLLGVSTQVVERNGDLRLSSATLRLANLTGSKFKIEQGQNNTIEIFAS